MRREAFEALGGFDEEFFMFAEDLDLCFRAHEMGFGIGYDDRAVVTHVEGVSRRRQPYKMLVAHHRSALRFHAKHAHGLNVLLVPFAALVLGLRLVVAATAEYRARTRDGS
jgi:N-acetylglucosaminyl-diphospho-decaprenol L-rhamnosyltransferase